MYHHEPPSVRRSSPRASAAHSHTLAPMSCSPFTPVAVAVTGAARGQGSGSLVLAPWGLWPVVQG